MMILKPQDILVLLKLVAISRNNWSYHRLAIDLGMSAAEVHAAIKRAVFANLAIPQGDKSIPYIRNLQEFIVHGLRFVFIPEHGGITRGIPTSHAAPPLSSVFLSDGDPPPVWPDSQGLVRGMSFSPLYASAPKAALADPILYELLVLVDAIRGGRARERSFATKELTQRLEAYAQNTKP